MWSKKKMTKILKSRYKYFWKTGIRFNARRSKIRLTLNKLNLKLWNNIEYKKQHKKSRHPKFKDTLWRLSFKSKQEMKAFYGNIPESVFQKWNKKNKRKGKFLINIFETKLDVIIFKINWAMSIYHAKQLISHGHILVNGIKVQTPSYILQPNDLVQVSSNPESRKLIKQIVFKKISRINSVIKLIYFRRLPYFFGGLKNLRNKLEYWLFSPLSLEIDYFSMSVSLIFSNENERMFMYHPLKPFNYFKV